jgi:hypothetical protein
MQRALLFNGRLNVYLYVLGWLLMHSNPSLNVLLAHRMHRADVSFVRAPQAAITQAGLPLDRLCAGNRTIDSGVEDSELDPLFPPLDAEPASGGGLDVSLERYRLITSRLQAAVSGRGGLEFMPSLVRSTKMEPFLGAAAKEIDSPQEEEGAGSSSPLSPLTPRGKGHTPPQLSMKSRSSSTLSERFWYVNFEKAQPLFLLPVM